MLVRQDSLEGLLQQLLEGFHLRVLLQELGRFEIKQLQEFNHRLELFLYLFLLIFNLGQFVVLLLLRLVMLACG